MTDSQLLIYQHNDSTDKKKDSKLISRNYLDKKIYLNVPKSLNENQNKIFE